MLAHRPQIRRFFLGQARSYLRGWRLVACLLSVVALLGSGSCRPSQQGPAPPPESATEPLRAEGVKLTLAVIDDPALAAAIRRRRGEWAARSGGSLRVVELAAAAATSDAAIVDADALVYPSWLLGTLVGKQAIIPIRHNVLSGALFAVDDIFPIVRRHSMTWGDRAVAFPLGSPVLTLWYRADLLDQLNLTIPSTWDDYARLAERLGDRSRLGAAAGPADAAWYGTVEPLAAPWAAHLLLARAASYARSPSRYSALFDIETMRPLIAQPPFVRALEELRATLEPLDLPPVDPAGALQLLLDGHAAMALTWATATDLIGQHGDIAPAATTLSTPPTIGVAALPGSRDFYSVGSRSWETRIEGSRPQVPAIGLTGRIGSVTRSTRNAPTAMRLLAWLSGPELSAQVSPASRATTLFRRAHLAAPGVWAPAATGTALAHDYANLVAKILDHEIWLGGLRIPAADQYVAALDDAVRKALAGDQAPAAALAEAADQWQGITQRLGLAAQKKAYAASLGL